MRRVPGSSSARGPSLPPLHELLDFRGLDEVSAFGSGGGALQAPDTSPGLRAILRSVPAECGRGTTSSHSAEMVRFLFVHTQLASPAPPQQPESRFSPLLRVPAPSLSA